MNICVNVRAGIVGELTIAITSILKVGNDMIIMLFGISNVGKTVTGEKLAQKLNYS